MNIEMIKDMDRKEHKYIVIENVKDYLETMFDLRLYFDIAEMCLLSRKMEHIGRPVIVCSSRGKYGCDSSKIDFLQLVDWIDAHRELVENIKREYNKEASGERP